MISKHHKEFLREAAKKRGAKLKITDEGQIHFYGKIPGKEDEKGWYFVGWDAENAVRALILEEDI